MLVKNWKYFEMNDDIGPLKITKGQFMTGNILGIIAEKKEIRDRQGNMMNAKSYNFPVRIKFVENYTGENYDVVAADICEKIAMLEQEGCRFIVTTGGRLGLFDKVIRQGSLIALTSPIAMIGFATTSIPSYAKICIVNDLSVEENCTVLDALEVSDDIKSKCIFTSLQQEYFYDVQGQSVERDVCIGAYIWDDREDYHNYIGNCGVPVYSVVKVANFIKNVVTQIPYEGVI